jgi:hypothetical protein
MKREKLSRGMMMIRMLACFCCFCAIQNSSSMMSVMLMAGSEKGWSTQDYISMAYGTWRK